MARALRPRIDIGPGERAAERLDDVHTQALRRNGGDLHLPGRPGLPRLGISVQAFRREGVIEGVVGRMNGDKLTLKRGHQFGGCQPVFFQRPRDLVGIGPAFGATVEVEEAGVRARELQPLIAEACRPLGDRRETVKRRPIARKLRDEQRRSFDRAHAIPPSSRFSNFARLAALQSQGARDFRSTIRRRLVKRIPMKSNLEGLICRWRAA